MQLKGIVMVRAAIVSILEDKLIKRLMRNGYMTPKLNRQVF